MRKKIISIILFLSVFGCMNLFAGKTRKAPAIQWREHTTKNCKPPSRQKMDKNSPVHQKSNCSCCEGAFAIMGGFLGGAAGCCFAAHESAPNIIALTTTCGCAGACLGVALVQRIDGKKKNN